MPAASSMVGSTSMCWTGESIRDGVSFSAQRTSGTASVAS